MIKIWSRIPDVSAVV